MFRSIRHEDSRLRKTRERNTTLYRLAHWPIWIWVFFLAPGPLTFALFATGARSRNMIWLAIVLLGTGLACWRGKLPGSEPGPYILRFTEDRPNPLYRCICYTFAWSAIISFATLNLIGLIIAAATGTWHLKQIYEFGYFPLSFFILALGAAGVLPRVRDSTAGEGTERRYFYGSLWAVTIAQTVLLILWKWLPRTHAADCVELALYALVLAGVALTAVWGLLPRTRPIRSGELIVAD